MSGNLDNVVQSLGQGQSLSYIIWSEDSVRLKVMRSQDGISWVKCADLPNQSGVDVRMPTIYVDLTNNIIWVATAELTTYSDIKVWYSTNRCTSWNGPANATMNSGFSDGPGLARLGNNLYIVNDDSTTAQANPGRGISNADINLSVCDLQGTQPVNCTGTRAVYKNAGFPQIIASDGDLHLVSGQWQAGRGITTGTYGLVVYCVSQDGGQTWKGDPIPDSSPNAVWVNSLDFGYMVSRNRIAVDQQQGVYIVWATSQEGKSQIMLSTRNTLPTGTPSTVCAP